MAFNLTVEMGGLVIFDPKGQKLLAADHGKHSLHLCFRPYHLDEGNSELPTQTELETDKWGNRFLTLKKNWQVVFPFPTSKLPPSEHEDHRDWKYALPISELGLTNLKAKPTLCGDLFLPEKNSVKGTLGQLPKAYHFPATKKDIGGIGDKLYWRAQYSESTVDLEIWDRGVKEIGNLCITTQGSEVTVDAACVPVPKVPGSKDPFGEHKGLEQLANGTCEPPRPTRTMYKSRHVGSGSCPPTRR